MDDNNLNYVIKKSLPSKHDYVGTFTSDDIVDNPLLLINLISKKDLFLSFVANTLKASNVPFQVGNWVAFVIFKSKSGLSLKYFDSFADSPRKYSPFGTFIMNIKKKCLTHKIPFNLDTMKRPIQGPYSKLCGLYAAYAEIKSHHKRQSPLKKIFDQFSSNLKANDRKILYFLFKQWPRASCHDEAIYNNMKMSLDFLRKQPPFCPKITLSAKKCFKKCTCSTCCQKKKLRGLTKKSYINAFSK